MTYHVSGFRKFRMIAWFRRTDISSGSQISQSRFCPLAKIMHSGSTEKQRRIFLLNWLLLDICVKEFLATIVGLIDTGRDHPGAKMRND